MKRFSLCLLAVCFTFALTASAGDDAKKNLEQLRKDLADTQKKEKELQDREKELRAKIVELERIVRVTEQERLAKEEADRKVREEADKKKHYAKIELRGKLTNAKVQPTPYSPDRWYVSTNEVGWPLNFGPKNEHLSKAQKFLGQAVLVKGTISVNTKPGAIYPRTLPDRWWPGTGHPIQDVPRNPIPHIGGTGSLPTVDVESIEVVDITPKK